MGNIFVRRPIFAMVIAIMIVVLGLIAIRSMPIEQYPDITPPVVEVSAEYLGADALTIEQSVATPLEESVNGVSDMIYMQSTNSNNGSMSLQVSFAVGTDPDMNTIFTQNRVSSATPMLPQVVIKQGVTTEKTMSSFIQVLSLYSDGRYDENFLGNYAILHIKDRLARINGVGSVQVMGGGAYAMRIWVKPDRMDYLGVTVADIASAIEQQSEVIPGGQLGAEPNDGSAQFTYTVRMPAQYNTVEQFERIVLRAEPDGSLVYLKDVADVELGSQTYDVYSTYQQQPSSMIMINQSPGSNAVEVGKEVNAAMRELSQSFPEGMHYHTIVDSTRTILLGIHDIVVTLALALLLVVLVIYLFLQNIRATIVPIIAIPVSLVGAFMVFPLFGFSINVFSLLGLVLAIGLVVDDAIVVVEAVQVNIEKGMNGKDATIAAMKTVASPIIATTTVLMAVFLPVGLMPGAAGKLYGQFAITIAISVALSGVNALSLSPALCSILLRPQSGKKTKGFFGWFNRRFGRSVDSYLKTSKIMVRHSARTLIFIAISVIAVLLLLKTVPTGFLPNEDQGYLMADVQLPEAASLNRTKEAIDRINSILRRNDNVQSVTSVAGFSILSGNQSPNSGLIFIRLKDWSQRKMTAGQITTRLNEQLYYEINSAQVYTFGPPSIPGLGPGSGFTIMIQDKGGNTPGYLADYTDRFIAAARQRPEIATISTTFQADEPQKAISIDNEKVLKAGISLDELHSQISSYLGGMYVNNFNRFGRMYQTYIQAEDEYRLNESKLDMFYLTNDRGESVPLSAFITVRDTTGPQFTNRFNLYRAAGVTGLPASEYSTAQAMKALEEVADEVLPSDMGYAWSNMSYQEAQKSRHGIPIRGRLRLPDPRSAVRKLDASAQYPAGHSLRSVRGSGVHLSGISVQSGLHQRHFSASIAHHADRTGSQECDSDRRIRARQVRRGDGPATSRAGRSQAACPPRRHDGRSLPDGRASADTGHGKQCRCPQHHGPRAFRRHAGRYGHRAVRLPGPVRTRRPHEPIRAETKNEKRKVMKNPKYLPLLLASAALFGCTVGPRFEPPAVAIPQRYIGQVSDAASDLGWWKLFNDTTLVRLVSTALRNNRNIAVALSRVEQARLTLKATKASLGPSVGYGLDAQYGTESYVGLTTDKPEQSYMIKPTISWEVDLFGKIRRMSEADRAQMLATDRAAQGVMVSLAAEVATTYFDYLQYEYAEYISRSTLRSREDTYRLMESSYRAGTINEMELSQSRAAVATAQAAIPRFERARQQALHALSLLLGQNPSDDLIGRHASLAELDMPEEIPAGLPSDLLERRPDMQEAYYQVMAANAEIGVAQAMRFPSIALTANGGTLSDDVSRLFGSKSYLWSVAGNLTGPVFQFGANKRRVQIAREKHRESVLNYEQCYLQALREVEDALTAVNTYRAQIEAMKTLVRSAERADTVAMQRYRGGLTDYLDVLDAERTLFEAQTDYADAVGSAMSSYVTLYKALGGGITMPATEAN